MERIAAILIPSLIKIIEEAFEVAKGNDEAAIAYLQGIIGASEENKIRATIVVEQTKALKAIEIK